MAKIAVGDSPGLDRRARNGSRRPARRVLARGDGWSVSHVLCQAGPFDRPFEEQHTDPCIAVVLAGSFQYRSTAGRELMTPGSLLLGNSGQWFECGHEHGVGDRCLSFSFEQHFLERLGEEAGARGGGARFKMLRVPPLRELSSIVSRAAACLATEGEAADWEDVAVELAGRALTLDAGTTNDVSSPAAEARVTRIVRLIERQPDSRHDLAALAAEAKLTRYHFVRLFRQIAGVTPHQYVLRSRLRDAATRLVVEPARVLDIALESGFDDVSAFNRAFRAEFGVSPRSHRKRTAPLKHRRRAAQALRDR